MARILRSLAPLFLSALSLPGCGHSSSAACVPGPQTINGVQTRQFCGPARATASINGQQESWAGGTCFMTAGEAGVDIGRVIIDPTNSPQGRQLQQRYDYFGAAAAATSDGTYPGTLTADFHGQETFANGDITFTHHLQAGTFTGHTYASTQITAVWTC